MTTGNTAGLPAQGLTGFEELEGHNDPGQGVSSVGYTLQDINNDKVPELIFAILDNEKQGKQAELQSFRTATMYQNADKRRHPD